MAKDSIIEGNELPAYFREKVQQALTHQGVEATEMTEFYLVNLLHEFRHSDKLFTREGDHVVEKPLAILLAEALEGDTATRIRSLKKIGDVALYTAGYFAQKFHRMLVDPNYFISMGCSAYHNLAGMMPGEKVFGALYSELAQKFPALVNILKEVASDERGTPNVNLLQTYERWLATGDARLMDVLRREGIFPQPIELKTQ
ncbi:MAG: hypothetical protein HY540_04795 [Deltaproteobacteria bacterium]|nr:hypothetical protein [Deltaproteobacteria bacterium]